MEKENMTYVGSEQAREASMRSIEKIKSGKMVMKQMPNSSEDFPENKAFESGKKLIDSGFIQDIVDRF